MIFVRVGVFRDDTWYLHRSVSSFCFFFEEIFLNHKWMGISWTSIFLFPNSFSYGVFANIGSGAVPGRLPRGRFREVPGRFRGRFRITGSGKVPGQVPNHGFREGSGAGSERQVPGRFRTTFWTTGSGKVPGQVPNHGFWEGSGAGSERQVPGRFRTTFWTTGSGKVPGQVPIHEFREVSGAGSESRVRGAELEKDARADFVCLHCYPNAVGDNTWAYCCKL